MSISAHGNTEGDGNGGGAVEGDDQDDPSSSSSSSSSPPLTDGNVLDNFRKEWQRELESSPQHGMKKIDCKQNDEAIPHNVEDKAKVLFQMGVENEEKGKLYEAIQYYRRAFQLVPDIEFRMSQQAHPRPVVESVPEEISHEEDSETSGNEFDEVVGENEEEVVFEDDKTDLLTHLQYLMQRACQRTICVPQHDQNGTHISALPMEIFLYILRWVVSVDLDLRSLEMCSQVSRGFYICCRDPEIWRLACSRVWGVKCGSFGVCGYSSWREMFIQRPRLQFSGCYISKTTYIRPGENSFQDQFYRPWHLVQYYRYLRFFSDGRVLMLTTVEDPVVSVGLLRGRCPPPRHPPVSAGYYRLHENMVSLVVTQNLETKRTSRPNTNSPQNHTFHLELEIVNQRSRTNSKLIWHGYSVFTKCNGIETNTTFDLDAGRYPPFRFSRVKSYTAEALNPLM